MKLLKRRLSYCLLAGALFTPLATFSLSVQAKEPEAVRFGLPPWSGTMVKSQVAASLLDALGYKTRQRELGVAVIYQGLSQNELDAFMGSWLPSQQGMYDSVASNIIKDLGNNVDGAQLGFVVPTYMHEAGITSANDLCDKELQKKAGGIVYSIEAGSGTSDLLEKMQKNSTYCLNEWNLSETSATGMFSQAKAMMDRDEWIVFYAWTPHWAAVEYDIQFLKDPEDAWGPDGGRSDVRSLVTQQFADTNPNATQMLEQLVLNAYEESEMITMHGYEERTTEDAALTWIRNNPDRIKVYLDGVTTRDGQQAAWPVVQKALEIPEN